MRRSPRTSNSRRYATLAYSAAFTLFILLAFQLGCGNANRSAFAPLPAPSSGAVIAGSAHAQGGAALQGVVVTLEAIDGGVSASVYRAIRGQAPAARAQNSSSGKPLASTPARIGDRLASAALASPSRSTVTDIHGRFAFTEVPAGAYLLTGIAQNHIAGIVRANVRPYSSTAAETTIVDIAMMPTGKFYGNVTLENATNHQSTVVYVDGSSYVAVTNAAGNFTLEGVPVGSWVVRGTHPGYLDRSVSGSITAAGDSLPLPSFQLPLNSNLPPTASPSLPTSPVAHTLTGLSGTGSDADGSIVRYEWDFTNDGTFDYSSASTASTTHDYGTAGTYLAKLRVTDNQGAIGLSVVTVNVVDGVFISASGSDANPGTYDQPVATLGNGFTLASIFNRKYIYVATGTYTETPLFPAAAEVRGGMTTGTTWTQSLGNYSIVNVGTSPALIKDATTATLVSGMDIRASNQVTPGGTSIALSISNSTSALLLTDCKFTAGNGAGGIPKPPGASGGPASGAPGQAGGIGGAPGGGNGGTGGGGGGGNGGTGGPSLGCNGGGFGGSTFQCSPGGGGQNGFNACAPGDGANGASLVNGGQTASGVWNPAAGNNGANGAGGAGGGGGGGGGNTTTGFLCGNTGTGGNGGGGGGGGGYGTGGAGGNGGGASFAVYLYNALPTFSLCYFTSKNGGNGGNGGSGGNFGLGAGGASGLAGSGTPIAAGTGGTGAAGLRGGGGGAGGGGAGGISACVANAGVSGGNYDSNSFTTGLPGFGGTGGTHPVTFVVAPTGLTGSASQTVTLPGN